MSNFLTDFYNKAKKKLQDWEQPIQKSVSSGIGNAYNSAKNYLGDTTQNVERYVAPKVQSFEDSYVKPATDFFKANPTPYSYVAPKVKSYFGNDATVGGIVKNTFKPSNLGKALIDVPNHKYDFADKVSWKNPVVKLPAEMAQGAMNTFHNVQDYANEASDQYYGNKKADFGALAGKGLNAALDLGGLAIGGGEGEKLLKAGTKTVGERMAPSLKSAIWQGAKDTSKIMGRFGAGYSLADSLKNHESVPQSAMNVAQGYAGGRIAGAVMGGAMPALGAGAKALSHDVRVKMGKNFGQEDLIPKRIWQTHEDNSGVMVQGRPQRQELPSAVRKPNNIPADGDRNHIVLPAQKFNPNDPQLPNVFRQIGDAMPRPGMNIEAVPGEKPNLDALIAQKQARAKALVNKQIENQKVFSDTAEPGFVAPQKVVAPAKTTSNISEDIFNLSNSEFTPYERKAISVGKANPRATTIIKEKTGIDVSQFNHEVDNYALQHSFNKHSKDAMPLTKEDFRLIPDIIENPSSVAFGDKTKQGLNALKYSKRYNGTTYYIEEVRTGNNTLSMTTMYKTKTPSGGANLATGTPVLDSRRLPQIEETTPQLDVLNKNTSINLEKKQTLPSIEEFVNGKKEGIPFKGNVPFNEEFGKKSKPTDIKNPFPTGSVRYEAFNALLNGHDVGKAAYNARSNMNGFMSDRSLDNAVKEAELAFEKAMNPTEVKVGEVLEKNLNNRPYVKPTKTITDVYETYIAPVAEKTKKPLPSIEEYVNGSPEIKKLAETAGDLLEKTPQGKNQRLEAGEPNIMNQPKWLRSIGAIRNKKDLEKIGFKEGQGIIENWRMKHQPDYPAKKAEIDRFKNFVADYKQSEEAGIARGLEYLKKYSDIPNDKGSQIIHFIENPSQAPEELRPHVENLKNEFASFFDEAQNAGLDVGNWRDYVTHIWAESPREVAKKIKIGLERGIITADDLASPNATTTPFFRPSNARTLKTYEAGEKIGLHMKYDQPAQIVAHYAKQLEKAKSVVRNIDVLKNAGEIVDGIQEGMKPLDASGMEGLSAEPKLADKINNAFRDQSQEYYTETFGKILEKAAGASRWLKEALMSGGIPSSTVNSYGIGMTLKEIGTLSPTRAKNAIESFIVANNPRASRQFFIDNLDQIKKIKSQDISLSTMLDKGGFVDKGFWGNLFGEKGSGFSGHWNAIMNEPTFGRYLPMNQIKFFNSIESRLLEKGYSSKDAVKIAAKELREGMGLGSAAKQSATPQWKKDVLETAFFAPTHRANMFRVFGNAFKTVARNPLKPGNQSAAQFLAGGMAVYGLYDLVNYKNTGHHMWDNPEGKKFEAYISTGDGNYISIPFMPSVATMPRLGIDVTERLASGDLGGAVGRAWQGSGSLLTKPIADVVMNKDYFNRDIANEKDDPSKQWADRGIYLAKSYSGHPWIKAGIDVAGGKSLDQVAVQASEAPIRFNTEDKLSAGKYWEAKNRIVPIYEKYVRLSKTDPAQADEFYKQNQADIEMYPQITAAAKMYTDLKKDNAQDQFGGIMKNDGFNFSKKPNEGYFSSILGSPVSAANAQTEKLPLMPSTGSITGDKIKQRYETQRQKEDFLNSDDKTREYNGEFWYKKDGEVKTKSIDQRNKELDSSSSNLEMDRAQARDDINAWAVAADKKIEAINKYLGTLDSAIDQDEIDRLTLEKENLLDKAAKYAEYGGFKKGRKAAKLEEKYRYPLVDPEFMKINALIGGITPRKARITRRPMGLIRRPLPVVHRTRRR